LAQRVRLTVTIKTLAVNVRTRSLLPFTYAPVRAEDPDVVMQTHDR
jgi:hypothetical protein